MVVSWSPPATHLQNGEIISYRVVVTRTGYSAVLNTTTESVCYSLSDLYPHVNYTVSVSAINSAGEGPSSTMTVVTDQDGELRSVTNVLVGMDLTNLFTY